jgi:hypothetical protein
VKCYRRVVCLFAEASLREKTRCPTHNCLVTACRRGTLNAIVAMTGTEGLTSGSSPHPRKSTLHVDRSQPPSSSVLHRSGTFAAKRSNVGSLLSAALPSRGPSPSTLRYERSLCVARLRSAMLGTRCLRAAGHHSDAALSKGRRHFYGNVIAIAGCLAGSDHRYRVEARESQVSRAAHPQHQRPGIAQVVQYLSVWPARSRTGDCPTSQRPCVRWG